MPLHVVTTPAQRAKYGVHQSLWRSKVSGATLVLDQTAKGQELH